MKHLHILAASALLCAAVSCSEKEPLYKDPSAPIEKRVNDLLDRMSLDEMIAQMNLLPYWPSVDSSVRAEIAADRVGAILKASGTALNRDLQEAALKSSRLGIPLMFHEDVIHGFRTIFPIPLAEACSWDPTQVEENSAAIAREAAAAGLHLTYAPMVDVSTDGRWGRIMETSGEDPYLSGVMSAARVRGFQGQDLSDPYTIMACVKHFAGYAKLQGGRDYQNTEFSLRELEETYLPPYRACIEAGVGALMESYTMYDGLPVSFSKFLLNDVLRNELGYEGLLMTDWKTMFYAYKEGAVDSEPESVRKAINAGIDMDMTSGYSVKHLRSLVESGAVSKKRVRDAAYHCLYAKFQMGLFEDPFRYFDEEREKEEIMSDEIRSKARAAAAGSMVLLKNDWLLPLEKGYKVGVYGSFAEDKTNYLGAWACKGRPEECVSVKEGLSEIYTLSNDSHLAVVAIGEPVRLIGEGVSTGTLEFSEADILQLQSLRAAGKYVITVLFNGRPMCLKDVLANSDAVLEAWYPGTEAGHAIADILCGDYNPSGRLCQTFPKHVGQIPILYNPIRTFGKVVNEGVGGSPQFPFGYGLSYSEFEYSEPRLMSADSVKIGDKVRVSVDVKNVSKVDGTETVQLYVADLFASVIPREKNLKAFQHVLIKAGETKTIEFELDSKAFEIYSADHKWTVEPGEFRIEIGRNSADTKSVNVWLQ